MVSVCHPDHLWCDIHSMCSKDHLCCIMLSMCHSDHLWCNIHSMCRKDHLWCNMLSMCHSDHLWCNIHSNFPFYYQVVGHFWPQTSGGSEPQYLYQIGFRCNYIKSLQVRSMQLQSLCFNQSVGQLGFRWQFASRLQEELQFLSKLFMVGHLRYHVC